MCFVADNLKMHLTAVAAMAVAIGLAGLAGECQASIAVDAHSTLQVAANYLGAAACDTAADSYATSGATQQTMPEPAHLPAPGEEPGSPTALLAPGDGGTAGTTSSSAGPSAGGHSNTQASPSSRIAVQASDSPVKRVVCSLNLSLPAAPANELFRPPRPSA